MGGLISRMIPGLGYWLGSNPSTATMKPACRLADGACPTNKISRVRSSGGLPSIGSETYVEMCSAFTRENRVRFSALPPQVHCEVAKLVRQEILNLRSVRPAFASKLLGGAIPVSQPGFELGLWRFDSFPPSQANPGMTGSEFRHSRAGSGVFE
jgi:hypothetical protein